MKMVKLLFILLAILFIIAGCKKNSEGESISLSHSAVLLTLTENKTIQLTAKLLNVDEDNKTIVWKSEDTNVATVNNYGQVTAVGIGTTNVIAENSSGSLSALCKVTVVNEFISVETITINTEEVFLSMNGTNSSYQLEAVVLPENASDKTIAWESTNTAVVTVDSTGKLTATGLGGPVDVWAVIKNPGAGKWFGVLIKVTVTGMKLSTNNYMVQKNYTPQMLVPTLSNSGVSIQSVSWSSDNQSVASVDNNGVVSFPGKGKAKITCTVTGNNNSVYKDECKVTVYERGDNTMAIGQNLWNFGWSNTTDYIKSEYIKDENGDGKADIPNGANIWNQQFLSDLGTFDGTIRFMDWTNANVLPLENFDEYPDYFTIAPEGSWDPMGSIVFNVPQKYRKYYNNSSTLGTCTVPYKYMVDLCNRTGRDMWINIPNFANDDYVKKLALLLKETLDPKLKIYLEYSNETWNGMFVAFSYCNDMGEQLDMPGSFGSDDGYNTSDPNQPRTNKYYQGQSYTIYRSLQIFEIFEEVFGESNMGLDKRVVRVIAGGGDLTLMLEGLRYTMYQGVTYNQVDEAAKNGATLGNNVLVYNEKWNPHNQKADILSTAPYIGSYGPWDNSVALDGKSPNIASEWNKGVDYSAKNVVANYIRYFHAYGAPYAAYEGGQHLGIWAADWSLNPDIYGGYKYMMEEYKKTGIILFNHYTLYGGYNQSDIHGQFWGAKANAGSSGNEAYKFQAISDWVSEQYQ